MSYLVIAFSGCQVIKSTILFFRLTLRNLHFYVISICKKELGNTHSVHKAVVTECQL